MRNFRGIIKFPGVLVFSTLVACNSSLPSFKTQIVTSEGITSVAPETPALELPDSSSTSNPLPADDTTLKFCSPLSFEGVTWNKAFTLNERRSFAIALSVTGNFEGPSGWSNLTNNFDGQGMSAGLLNQTLGTGSLQPLLIAMKTNHPDEFKNSLTEMNYNSISKMLDEYQLATALKIQNFSADSSDEKSLDLIYHKTEISNSQVSSMANDLAPSFSIESAATNQSVDWAIGTLYLSNNAFKPDWKKQLLFLLNDKNYVSLQISAAEKIHARALAYVHRIGLIELRTYLLMFDIVTQNGSISESRWTEWENAIRATNMTDPSQKLKTLIDIRLKDVKPVYVADVKSRKYAIIDGVGTVHGSKLNLPTSYCYKPGDVIY